MKIDPNSEQHQQLVTMIMQYARRSSSVVSARHSSWNLMDQAMTAYVPLDQDEYEEKANDPRKPIRVVVPVTYASCQVLLTYLTASIITDSIYRYAPVDDMDVAGVAMLELFVNTAARRYKHIIHLHNMWRDALVYGIGPVLVGFDRTMGYKREVGIANSVFNLFRGRSENRIKEVVFEGGTLTNLDPYNFLPDPSLPIEDLQKGNFIGWVDKTSLITLKENSDIYYNLEHINYDTKKTSSLYYSGRDVNTKVSMFQNVEPKEEVDVLYCIINLIPSDHGLSGTDTPEKWFFAIAADSIIIRSEPLPNDHNMFPVVVDAPNFDGHSLLPTAILETSYGLQEAINWMFHAHVTNVRKAITDRFVVDPLLINTNDLESTSPVIRTRRQMWGKGVENGIKQLQVVDVTRQHVQDISFMTQFLDLTTGSVDAIKGVQRRSSERVSATEAQGVMNSALSRLEKMARMSSVMSIQDIAYMLAKDSMQFMSIDHKLKLGEQFAMEHDKIFGGSKYVNITKDSINVDYDVVVNDGTLPNNTNPQVWTQLFQVIASNEGLAQQFDVVRIFQYLAKILGAKNLNDFVAKVEVAPDEEVIGNPGLTPMEGML